MTKTILQDIRIDGGTQARVELNMDTVAEYTAFLKEDDANDLPAARVYFDGTNKWLADGFHRHFAYTAAGRASMPTDIRTGTQRDAILYACGANAEHGLKRTNEDKRKAVGTLLADPEWSKMGDREIGRLCKVDHKSVGAWRNPPKVVPPAPIPKPEKKTGGAAAGGTETSGTPTGAGTPPAGEIPTGTGTQAETPPVDGAAAESEANAAAAHGDTDMAELLQDTQRDLEAAQRQIEAAGADDLKAEAMKWQRLSEIATRRQNEIQTTLVEREAEIKRHVNTLRRIGRAVGEEDPTKVAATVEQFVKSLRVVA